MEEFMKEVSASLRGKERKKGNEKKIYCNYSIDLVHLQSNGRRNCFGAVQNSIHEFLYKDECIRLISKVAGVKNRRQQMFSWSLTFTCCLYLLKGGKIKFE